MLFVLPTTSAIHPTSYLVPQSHGYYPSRRSYYPHYDVPPMTSQPSHFDFFRQPSVEELEEQEYRRALEVVANHRRREAEQAAAIRRQQLAEASRQRYFVTLAAELEQRRRQEELLAARRRAELIRSQRVRENAIALERQHAINAFLRQLEGPQPVRFVPVCVLDLTLIRSRPQITRQPHVTKRKPITDLLEQRLAGESDADITGPIKNILSYLEPRPVESEKPKDPSEDAHKLIENLLSSIFPGLFVQSQPEPVPSTEQTEPTTSDSEKGKGKARAVDVNESQPKSESADETFANILRHVMELSKSAPTPRSPDEAGPSGTTSSSSSTTKPAATEREQAHINRAIALSSVEHAQNTLTKLQADFVLPAELDHYAVTINDREETGSVSSVSSSDLTKLIPYSHANKSVYKYENELNGLLEELDKIDSNGDVEVREKRKEVVKAVEKALENVEHVVGEAVEKRLLIVPTSSATDEPLKGYDVDDDVPEETVPVQEQDDTPIVASQPSAPVQVEEPVTSPAEVPSPTAEALPETDLPTITETGVAEQAAGPEFDVESSTTTITPDSVNPTSSVPEIGGTESQGEGTPDTFLLYERVSPPSPVKKAEQTDSDVSDDEVLSLDSEAEKSDWSEVEH